MESEELKLLFRKKFEEFKQESGLKTELSELNWTFSLEDSVLHEGFVSELLGRQMSSRINDLLMNWLGYFHSLLLPNQGDLINQTEAKLFSSETERKRIWELIREVRVVASQGNLTRFDRNNAKDAEFIDSAFELCKNKLFPEIKAISERVYLGWKGENKK